MRAVNLIPREERRGAARSGNAVYALLGALGVVLLMVSAYVLTTKSIGDRQSELAVVEREVVAAEAQAAALAPYRDFAAVGEKRVQTVTQLATSRFDWQRAVGDLARVLPDNVWLSAVTGTVKPGVSVGNGGGGTSSLRGALPVPAMELVGCTEAQEDVAKVMTSLRRMRGVTRVSLAASEKNDSQGAAVATDSAGSGGGDCRNGDKRLPKFEVVVFYGDFVSAGAAPPAPGAAAPASAAPGAAAPTPQGATTTPASQANSAEGTQ